MASLPDYKGDVQRIFKNFKPYNLATRKSEEDKLRENIKYYAKNKRVKDVAYIVVFLNLPPAFF